MNEAEQAKKLLKLKDIDEVFERVNESKDKILDTLIVIVTEEGIEMGSTLKTAGETVGLLELAKFNILSSILEGNDEEEEA